MACKHPIDKRLGLGLMEPGSNTKAAHFHGFNPFLREMVI